MLKIRYICLLLGILTVSASGVTLPTAGDAYTSLDTPRRNYGDSQKLHVNNQRNGDVRVAYVDFDLFALPEFATLERGVLRLFISKVVKSGPLTLHQVEGEWDESLITQGTAPAVSAPFLTINVDEADAGKVIEIDVTEEVNQWITGETVNNGIAILPGDEEVGFTMDSKENKRTSHPAELEVVLARQTSTASLEKTAYIPYWMAFWNAVPNGQNHGHELRITNINKTETVKVEVKLFLNDSTLVTDDGSDTTGLIFDRDEKYYEGSNVTNYEEPEDGSTVTFEIEPLKQTTIEINASVAGIANVPFRGHGEISYTFVDDAAEEKPSVVVDMDRNGLSNGARLERTIVVNGGAAF